MPITREELRNLIHQRCDIENSGFETDAETNHHINFAVSVVHDYLITTFENSYAVKSILITTVAGTSGYDLGSDFHRPISISMEIDGFYVPLNRFEDADVILVSTPESWGIGNMPEYTLVDTSFSTATYNNWGIQFNPPPDSVKNVLVKYHQTAPEFDNDTDEIFYQRNVIDLIIIEACLRIKDKEEREVTRLMQERSKIEERIKDWASPIDRLNPHGTIDIYNRTGWFDWRHKRLF